MSSINEMFHKKTALALLLILGVTMLGCKNPLGGSDERDSSFSPGGGGSGGGTSGDSEAPSPPTILNLSDRWATGANPATSPLFTWSNPSDDFEFAEVALGTSIGGEEILAFAQSQGNASHSFSNINLAECSVTYLPSVRATDAAGNASASVTETLGFRYDNTNPTSVTSVTIPSNDGNGSQTVSVDWSVGVGSDNCGIDHYEIALGYDDDSDGFDAGDVGNIIDWSEVPGGSATTSYQIVDGVDGFSFSSVFEREYFISIRVTDEAGLNSSPTNSAGWYTFYPTQVSNLSVWLDGLDLSLQFQDDSCNTTPVTTMGDPVGCWRDKTGLGNHATQSTGGNRPLLGVTGLDFDGTDDILTITTKNFVTASDVSMVVMYEADTQSNNGGSCCRPIVSYATNSTGLYPWLGLTRGNLVPANNLFHGWSGAGLSYIPTVPGDQFIISATQDGGNSLWNVWTLGQQQVVNQATGNITGTVFSVGGDIGNAARRVAGEIFEVFVIEDVISTTDREKLEGYLACKYDSRDNLDLAHPYYDLIGANKSGCP